VKFHGIHVSDGKAHGPTPMRLLTPFEQTYGVHRAAILIEHAERKDAAFMAAYRAANPPRVLPKPVRADAQSANVLRPRYLADMVGQDRMRALLKRLIDSAKLNGRPLDHVLLVGPAGTGKSTIALAIANELGTDCFRLESPVDHETLLGLREACKAGDVIFCDEAHLMSAGDRRGRTSTTTPEVMYGVLEDFKLVSGDGILDFPAVTFVAATTDAGMLPDAFVARFAIQPIWVDYTVDDLTVIAQHNATALGVVFQGDGAAMFARAGRLTPRVVNSYVRNAAGICAYNRVTDDDARTVLADLNGVTEDGLTMDMQRLMRWLLNFGGRTTRAGTTYQASLATLATVTGHSRDVRAVQGRIEPYLLACGLLRITSGGRALTDAGIARARQL
jgi:holliday junction DNA helicase RuvB